MTLGIDVMRFAGAKILLAGGGGFLGQHFINYFRMLNRDVLDQPCTVFSLDNYITGSAHRDSAGIMNVWCDISHPLPRLGFYWDYIIHCAGIASPVYYKKYPMDTIQSAVHGTINLLNLCTAATKGFLFFSSSEIYGDPDPKAIPTPETYHGYVSSVGPRACYDESKRLGETICTIYAQNGCPAKIVRPFNIFGPGMGHEDRRVIPMFTYEAMNNRDLPVHGNGEQTRTFCYVSDAIVGFIKVLLNGRPGEAYNIGNSSNEIAMIDLADLYGELIPGTKYKLIDYPASYPAGEPQRRCPDLSKARDELGYEPRVDLGEGLKTFIDWAKQEWKS